MKINKIVNIGKRHRGIRIYDQRSKAGEITLQWINVGRAIYPLDEAPLFDTVSLSKAYDIRTDKVAVERADTLPDELCFSDTTESETATERLDITLCIGGVVLHPYITQQGIAFIDDESLSPLEGDQMCVYERYSEAGEMYFAVKNGFELAALILPYTAALTPKLLTEIKTLRNLVEVALANKEGKQ